ncbi:MAG: phosphoribosylglycinamide formyltransferase [Planctomycetota bacterium]
MPARLGILLSGSGTTYQNLVDCIANGSLPAEIVVVVASRSSAFGLERAKQLGHPCVVAKDPTAALRAHRAEYVAMCGWMSYWDPPSEFRGRTVNVHPSLLPAFGGKGMYGHHVHEAVLKHGCKITGCTVHLVSGGYDTGPILDQTAVRVHDGDTPESLAIRVQDAEREIYPKAIASLISSKR